MTKNHIEASLRKELLIAEGEVLRLKLNAELGQWHHHSSSFIADTAWKALLSGSVSALLLAKTAIHFLPSRRLRQWIKNVLNILLLWRTIKKVWPH